MAAVVNHATQVGADKYIVMDNGRTFYLRVIGIAPASQANEELATEAETETVQ